MTDDRAKRQRGNAPDAETAESKVEGSEPFEKSRSAGDYDPNSNWAAARRTDDPGGAGDGGFGPEGGFTGKTGQPNADIIGQVRGSTERLVDQSKKAVEGARTPQRTEPDSSSGGHGKK